MGNGNPALRSALAGLAVAVGSGVAGATVLLAASGCGSARCAGAAAAIALVLGLVSLVSAGWLMLLALGGRPGRGTRSRSPGPG